MQVDIARPLLHSSQMSLVQLIPLVISGFAIILKTTTRCNPDWVFLARDGGKYLSWVHATKRNPQTKLKDPESFSSLSGFEIDP
jgi:Catalase